MKKKRNTSLLMWHVYVLMVVLLFAACDGLQPSNRYYNNGTFSKMIPLYHDSADGQVVQYVNGKLVDDYRVKNGMKHGLEEEYYKNGKVKEEGYWYKDKRIGWVSYFDTIGRVKTIRQYILFGDTNISRLNQVIRFDTSGDTVKAGSFYYTVYDSLGTIKNGQPFKFKIALNAHIFKKALVCLCDYDDNYRLQKGGICDTFQMKNYEIPLIPKSYKLGLNVIKGNIINYVYEGAGKKKIMKSANLYFTIKYYVQP